MKLTYFHLAVLAAGLVVFPGCSATRPVAQWEYKIERNTSPVPEEMASRLRILGQEGWVLITQENQTYYFKRPLR